MSFLSQLFGGGSSIDRELENLYTGIYARMTGVSEREARPQVVDMVRKAKEASQREGTDKLPEPYGDYLLQKERTDSETRELFARKRADGVTDADVRSWWNLHDLERRLIVEIDGISRVAVFTDEVGKRSNTGAGGRSRSEGVPDVRESGRYHADLR